MGGTAEEIGQQLVFDVEHTIFVAVGTNVDETKTTLIWAVHNFAGKNFCLLHVHPPPPGVGLSEFSNFGISFMLLRFDDV